MPYLQDFANRLSPVARRAVVLVSCTALLSHIPRLDAQELHPGELSERLRSGIHEAIVVGDARALDQMVTLARRAVTAFPDDAMLNHYAGYALHRLVERNIRTDPPRAMEWLEESESFLQRSIEIQPIAESHAILSSALGMRVVDEETAMTIGRQSRVEMGRARDLDPANPRVRLLEGVAAFHTPETWGGGHDAALAHFLEAIELFARDKPELTHPAWGLAETYAWLGQTYAALGRMEEARGAYERALEAEPGYAWVREVLLPGLGR